MLVKLAKATVILAMASGSVVLSAGGASAAHCGRRLARLLVLRH
jgi:hypothetical protein